MKLSELKAKIDGLCDMGYGDLKVKLGSLYSLGDKVDISESVNIADAGKLERNGTITFEINYTDREERAGKTVE